MRRALPALSGILIATATAGPPAQTLPREVVRLVGRIEGCRHFAGELNADRSARDREVMRAMDALHCGRIQRDVQAMRRRHADDARVLHALEFADAP